MRPFSRSRIIFYVSPYSRHKTGLAGGTEDSLPSTVDPWMWPKEWTVVCCTWCQGAAWAARAGARHRQHMSLPAQCSAVGHRTRVSQAHSVVCSTVGVGVTQQPTLSRAGAWLWVGHCFACPVRGCRQWSWHGQPAAQPCCTGVAKRDRARLPWVPGGSWCTLQALISFDGYRVWV